MINEEYIMGVKINSGLSWSAILDSIQNRMLKDNKSHYICTTNSEFIMDAQNDIDFKNIINNADLSLPDGVGVLQALAYLQSVNNMKSNAYDYKVKAFMNGIKIGLDNNLGKSLNEAKRTGVELVEKICAMSAQNNYSIFLLGGSPRDSKGRLIKTGEDISYKSAQTLRQRYPNINIIGHSSSFSRNESDDKATLAYIHEAMTKTDTKRLDFLFVAYNHIHQEKWIRRNQQLIPVNLSVGVGATLDYIAGHSSLAPDYIRNNNIEWLYRMIKQPWRYKRVLKAFPLFPLRIYLSSIS